MTPPPRPQFRVISCAVVLNANGSILLVQEAKPTHRGQWNLPGGHAENGESPLAAVVRELHEETSLNCRVVGLLGIYCGQSSIRFAFQMSAAEQLPSAGDEIMNARFFRPAEIAQLADFELVRPDTIRQIIASVGKTQPIDSTIFRSMTAAADGALRPCG
jgi:8-oxo-dGTP diphosphatase